MANPATLLHLQLESWRVSSGQSVLDVRASVEGTHEDVLRQTQVAMGYLRDIEELLAGLEAAGRKTRSFRSALPRWQAWVLAFPHSWIHASPGTVFESDHDLDVLENLADALDRDLPIIEEKDRVDIAATLEEIRTALIEDHSLPLPLRQHLHGLLKHASTVLEEYEIFGDFELRKAMDRLLVSVNAAGTASKEPGRWQAIKDKLIYPVMVGLALQASGSVTHLGEIMS